MSRVSASRMELLRARRRLAQVGRGASLLRRKREALVNELFKLARPAMATREQIAGRAAAAWPPFLTAIGQHGAYGLRPLGWPVRPLLVELRTDQVWGVAVAEIVERPPVRRTSAARGASPGMTGAAALLAAARFEELTELVLDAAPREALIRRLGTALARTSRQVQTLERRVSPALEGQIMATRQVLDEREREERVRLGRFLKRRG